MFSTVLGKIDRFTRRREVAWARRAARRWFDESQCMIRRTKCRLTENRPDKPPLTPAEKNTRVWHVVQWFWASEEEGRRVMNARRTWSPLKASDPLYSIVFHQLKVRDRSSRDIGDPRRLPYIKDIID